MNIAIKPGDVLELDGRISERLLPGDDYADSGYAGCQFRYPVFGNGPIKSVAVNLKVTGRAWKYRGDRCWVRVRVEFVGDCEPSTFAGGWIMDPAVTQNPNSWYANHPVKPV